MQTIEDGMHLSVSVLSVKHSNQTCVDLQSLFARSPCSSMALVVFFVSFDSPVDDELLHNEHVHPKQISSDADYCLSEPNPSSFRS
jgi:hypothetical protein